MTIRWGILGAAKFAQDHMAPALQLARGADFTAIATRDAAKAAPFTALRPGLRVHDSYDALLADADIDAVYIPLPNSMHIDWSIKALDAGKHVLCEKPIALRAGDIDALIAKRDETGLQAAEAYMIVHHAQWQRARDLIQNGAIGRLRHVSGLFCFNNAADTGNIRNMPDTGGGCIPDIGVYTYGATRFATRQDPLAITDAQLVWENGVDVVASVSAQFDGFTAHWMNSMRMANHQTMTFLGEGGTLILTTPFNAGVHDQAELVLQRGATREVERYPSVNQYVQQLEAFGRAIDGSEPFAWTLEDAQGTQALIDTVYAKAGR